MLIRVAGAMWLALLRDRGALLLAFVLPPLMFVVFAEVFSAAGDEDLALRVVLEDRVESELTQMIGNRLNSLDGLQVDSLEPGADAAENLRRGEIDAAIVIREEPGADFEQPPIVVLGDAPRSLAAAIVTGRVQRLLQTDFPVLEVERAVLLIDALAGPYTREQQQALGEIIAAMRESDPQGDDGNGNQGFVERQMLDTEPGLAAGISYYAGAVAILFLLFSATQAAMSLIDERNSGIVDRLITARGGISRLVLGKGLFLILQATAQATLIFVTAWWLYGLDLPGRIGPWLITTLLAASTAAWVGLLLASVCSTRQQAQTASAFVVLILAAIGGSMMPRFLMPGWLREIGWATPNAWAIESWHEIFWRDASVGELYTGWLVLAGLSLIAMVASLWLNARTRFEK